MVETLLVLLQCLSNKGLGVHRLSFGKKHGDKMTRILDFTSVNLRQMD